MRIDKNQIDWRYINLAKRLDRRSHMSQELAKAGITATRLEGRTFDELNWSASDLRGVNQRPRVAAGCAGCIQSHLDLWAECRDLPLVGVLEDDALFCDDFQRRLDYIQENFDRPWDIFYLSAVYHVNPPQHYKWCIGREFELTDTKHIHRVYASQGTHAYLVNSDSMEKLIPLLRDNIYRTCTIDQFLISVQPALQCFAFTPGCVFQIDNYSDLANELVNWSDNYKMGPHVFARRLEDFDYDNYNWAEGRI